MVARSLVEKDIDAGRRVADALSQAQTPVQAVLWLYLPEFEEFRLLVATSIVDRDGPLAAYKAIREALEGIPESQRPAPFSISAVSPSDSVVRGLRKVVRAGPAGSDVRISNTLVDDVYVQDAFVYRLN
ncbi:MAG: hypothetical protein HZA51_06975 [Planctomycetes bacterium]|nr:hypothetical protein [Planctomycetota bacterium]